MESQEMPYLCPGSSTAYAQEPWAPELVRSGSQFPGCMAAIMYALHDVRNPGESCTRSAFPLDPNVGLTAIGSWPSDTTHCPPVMATRFPPQRYAVQTCFFGHEL